MASSSNGLTARGQLAIGALVIILTIGGGFWSLANPSNKFDEMRNRIDDVEKNGLTLREHNEYRDQTRRAIERNEADVKWLRDQVFELRHQIDRSTCVR